MEVNYKQLLKALETIGVFAKEIGAQKEAATFDQLRGKLETDQGSSKTLEEQIFKARGLATYWIPSHISKQAWNASKKEELKAEFMRLKKALDEALMPPEPELFAKTTMQGLAGNKETTEVWGDPSGAEQIAKNAIEVVRRFSNAVFQQDMESAYNLCGHGLRSSTSVARFVSNLEKADKNFGGKAVECLIERVTYIWADAVAREKSEQGTWPKGTPKLVRRASVGAFWFTIPAENQGRWVAFWVVEEPEGYRIAKFEQYLQ